MFTSTPINRRSTPLSSSHIRFVICALLHVPPPTLPPSPPFFFPLARYIEKLLKAAAPSLYRWSTRQSGRAKEVTNLEDLLSSLLTYKATARSRAAAILHHPFLAAMRHDDAAKASPTPVTAPTTLPALKPTVPEGPTVPKALSTERIFTPDQQLAHDEVGKLRARVVSLSSTLEQETPDQAVVMARKYGLIPQKDEDADARGRRRQVIHAKNKDADAAFMKQFLAKIPIANEVKEEVPTDCRNKASRNHGKTLCDVTTRNGDRLTETRTINGIDYCCKRAVAVTGNIFGGGGKAKNGAPAGAFAGVQRRPPSWVTFMGGAPLQQPAEKVACKGDKTDMLLWSSDARGGPFRCADYLEGMEHRLANCRRHWGTVRGTNGAKLGSVLAEDICPNCGKCETPKRNGIR